MDEVLAMQAGEWVHILRTHEALIPADSLHPQSKLAS